jgi:hypothetical protein
MVCHTSKAPRSQEVEQSAGVADEGMKTLDEFT